MPGALLLPEDELEEGRLLDELEEDPLLEELFFLEEELPRTPVILIVPSGFL